MANVYRRGTKSVHIGTRRRADLGVEQIVGCNLDSGGSWLHVQPPGPECDACFGVLQRGSRRQSMPVGRSPVIAAATAGILAAGLVVGSSLDEPVNFFPVASLQTFQASPSPFATSVLVTPEPSLSPPSTLAPVLTPAPTLRPTLAPLATAEPQPTYPPIPTYPPLPTFEPLPTFDLPTLPPLLCRHPGEHVGVKDICTWPGNQ